MIFLGVDFESTGLKVEEDRIIEIGLVVWHAERKLPLSSLGILVWDHESYPILSDEVKKIVGLEQEDFLTKFTLHPKQAMKILLEFCDKVDYIVAHNGNSFDKPMMQAECRRQSLDFPTTPWIDTCTDIAFADDISTRKLKYLSVEHNFINFTAHRALADVNSMLRILSEYPVENIIKFAQSPTITIQALITFHEVDKRNKAKELGFRWNPTEKAWKKTIKEFQLEESTKNLPFEFKIIAG